MLYKILEKLAIENNVSALENYEIDYLEQIAEYYYPEMRAVIQLDHEHFIRCDYRNIFNITQYNKNIPIKIKLYEDGEVYKIPSGAIVKVEASIKSDREQVAVIITDATIGDNYIIVNNPREMCLCNGDGALEVRIEYDDYIYITPQIKFKVVEAVISEDTVIEDLMVTEKELLEEKITEAIEVSNELQNKITSGDLDKYALKTEVNTVKSDLTTQVNTNKTNIATNTTNIATNKTNITNLTTKFNNNRIFSVSSMSELESVLKTATAGTEIRIKAGTYTVDRSFQVPKGVTIKGSGDDSCIFKCNNTSINNVFRNKLDGTETGYNKFNITIEGINFDGVNTTHNITAVAFAHATNVTVRYCTFQRFNSWHCIEFNGCKHCYIKYNNFLDYGYTSGGNPSEVIQIDFCNNSTNYPWTCKYDSTHCQFIYIEENNFYKIKTTSTGAIGTHNYDSNGGRHEYIYVRNNSIDTVQSFFHLLGSHRIHIESNSGLNLQTFVTLGNDGYCDQNEGTICNNTVSGDFKTGTWGGGATSNTEGRFIYGKDNTITIKGFTITGNVCNSFNKHTIGLTCSDTTIANNRIYGSGRHGIWIYGGEKVTLTGNISMNCGQNTTGTFTDTYIGNNTAQNVHHSLFIGNVGNITVSDCVERTSIIEVNNVTL